MPFPSLSRLASSKADREDGKIKPPKQLAKAGIPLYILKKSLLQGDDDNRGGRLTFRPQAKKPGAKKDGDEGGLKVDDDDGAQEQEQEHAAAAAAAGPEFEVEIHSYGTMSRGQRREMLDLVEANMKPMYTKSQKGWSRAEKRAELSDRSTWLRFLLVLIKHKQPVDNDDDDDDDDEEGEGEGEGGAKKQSAAKTKTKTNTPAKKVIVGFIAFTVTYEPEVYDRPSGTVPVTYCYEIQVGPAYRCTGLGSFLMQQLHLTAQQVGVPDVRLTVFRENLNALRFYEKFGYVTYCDDPGDDYLILRKMV